MAAIVLQIHFLKAFACRCFCGGPWSDPASETLLIFCIGGQAFRRGGALTFRDYIMILNELVAKTCLSNTNMLWLDALK